MLTVGRFPTRDRMERENQSRTASFFPEMEGHFDTRSPAGDNVGEERKRAENQSRRKRATVDRRQSGSSVPSAESAAAPLLFALQDIQGSVSAISHSDDSARLDLAELATGVPQQKPRPEDTRSGAVHTIRDGEEALGHHDGRLYRMVFAPRLAGQRSCEVCIGMAEIRRILYSDQQCNRNQKDSHRKKIREQLKELKDKGYITVLRRGDPPYTEPTTYIAYCPEEALRRQIESGVIGWQQTGKRTRVLVRVDQGGKPMSGEMISTKIQRCSDQSQHEIAQKTEGFQRCQQA